MREEGAQVVGQSAGSCNMSMCGQCAVSGIVLALSS